MISSLHQKRISFIENDLSVEFIQLQPLIFKEIKDLQSWCIQKGIGFDIQLEAKEVLSDAMAGVYHQVPLTNAVKYSEASEIEIKSFRKGEQTQAQVKDCGRGIDPKDVPRIFDKGFTSTTDHHDQASTGMGLYLAKKRRRY